MMILLTNNKSFCFSLTPCNRIPCIDNKDLLQLAKENYERRQLVINKELQELVRQGLLDFGLHIASNNASDHIFYLGFWKFPTKYLCLWGPEIFGLDF